VWALVVERVLTCGAVMIAQKWELCVCVCVCVCVCASHLNVGRWLWVCQLALELLLLFRLQLAHPVHLRVDIHLRYM
jgi:hypothetical protein